MQSPEVKMMLRSLRFAVIALSIGVALGQASQLEWERIGLQKVNRKTEADSFSVGRDKNYQVIRIRAIGSGVIIEQWTLEYRDGSVQHVGFFGLAPEARDSPPVPVRPGLKKIRFRYHSVEGPNSAKIELQGR
jgi:hypothetical protein